MKKTFLILLLLFVSFSVSARRDYYLINPKHGLVEKNIETFNKIADILSSKYSFKFQDADSSKMVIGFSVIINPVYKERTKKIEKMLIYAHPFAGCVEMQGYSRRSTDKRVSEPVLFLRDSLYYYFSGEASNFFADPTSNDITFFLMGNAGLEFMIRAKKRAQERVRIMALPADNEERKKLEEKDLEEEKYASGMLIDERSLFEPFEFSEHVHNTKLSDYDSFVLLPKYDSKNKIVGWFVN